MPLLAVEKLIQEETFQKYLPIAKTLKYQPHEYSFKYMDEFRTYERWATERKRVVEING